MGLGISNPQASSKIHIYHRQQDVSANSFGTINVQVEPGGYAGGSRSRIMTSANRGFIDYKTESGGYGTWILGSHFNTVKDVLTINGKTSEVVVDGKFKSEEVKVEIINGADFVFEKDYNLKPLQEVEHYIKTNKHLPEIPSEKQMLQNGVHLGEMNVKLLQKIEELTLYTIQQQKLIEKVLKQNEKLVKRIETLEKQ